MIPAHPGYTVTFHFEPRPPERAWADLPVAAWADDGTPLVAAPSRGLVAPDLAEFDRPILSWQIVDGDAHVAAVIPGAGWRATYEIPDGETWTVPVLAWQIDHEGWGRAIHLDAEGQASAEGVPGMHATYWHPDLQPEPATGSPPALAGDALDAIQRGVERSMPFAELIERAIYEGVRDAMKERP